jgi:hypothetical protein
MAIEDFGTNGLPAKLGIFATRIEGFNRSFPDIFQSHMEL